MVGTTGNRPDLATRILDGLALPHTRLETVPDRPGHDRRCLLDATRLRTELGWTPTIPFDRCLADTVRWYAERPTWWQPLRERATIAEHAWSTTAPGRGDRQSGRRPGRGVQGRRDGLRRPVAALPGSPLACAYAVRPMMLPRGGAVRSATTDATRTAHHLPIAPVS